MSELSQDKEEKVPVLKTSHVVYAVINVLGMLLIGLLRWAVMERRQREERFTADLGDAFYFAFPIFYILTFCAALMLSLGVHASYDCYADRDYRGLRVFGVLMVAWLFFLCFSRI